MTLNASPLKLNVENNDSILKVVVEQGSLLKMTQYAHILIVNESNDVEFYNYVHFKPENLKLYKLNLK